jgi:hypothetical protein
MVIDRFMVRAALIGLALVLLAACSTPAVKSDGNADVESRAVARWDALIAHHAEDAYDFLSPGYRATITREAYAKAMNNRPVQWKKVAYNRKKCDADRCKVYLAVTFSANVAAGLGGPIESVNPMSETWIRVKGDWYYLPSN